MKRLTKFLFALFAVISASSVFAVEPSYVQSLSIHASQPKGQYSEAFIVNQTYESYMVYSKYRGTGRQFDIPLYAVGSGRDSIKFPIAYPDYAICTDVVQDYPRRLIFSDCFSSGTVYIHYTQDNKIVVEKR